MEIKEWVELLNGREYRNEITLEESKKLRDDYMVIAFGASDDLLEFRGHIDDEIGAWDGTTALITTGYDIYNEEENEESLRYNYEQVANFKKVNAVWCPRDESKNIYASWLITSDIPHETFDIMEDRKLYCRGIIFNMEDIYKRS